ncbi:MAG: hypothetical protein KDJ50_04695 [Alphaproteobacteria bacterium]|nr:hypothetical protein [Alphaproteobacteria bacterium]
MTTAQANVSSAKDFKVANTDRVTRANIEAFFLLHTPLFKRVTDSEAQKNLINIFATNLMDLQDLHLPDLEPLWNEDLSPDENPVQVNDVFLAKSEKGEEFIFGYYSTLENGQTVQRFFISSHQRIPTLKDILEEDEDFYPHVVIRGRIEGDSAEPEKQIFTPELIAVPYQVDQSLGEDQVPLRFLDLSISQSTVLSLRVAKSNLEYIGAGIEFWGDVITEKLEKDPYSQMEIGQFFKNQGPPNYEAFMQDAKELAEILESEEDEPTYVDTTLEDSPVLYSSIERALQLPNPRGTIQTKFSENEDLLFFLQNILRQFSPKHVDDFSIAQQSVQFENVQVIVPTDPNLKEQIVSGTYWKYDGNTPVQRYFSIGFSVLLQDENGAIHNEVDSDEDDKEGEERGYGYSYDGCGDIENKDAELIPLVTPFYVMIGELRASSPNVAEDNIHFIPECLFAQNVTEKHTDFLKKGLLPVSSRESLYRTLAMAEAMHLTILSGYKFEPASQAMNTMLRSPIADIAARFEKFFVQRTYADFHSDFRRHKTYLDAVQLERVRQEEMRKAAQITDEEAEGKGKGEEDSVDDECVGFQAEFEVAAQEPESQAPFFPIDVLSNIFHFDDEDTFGIVSDEKNKAIALYQMNALLNHIHSPAAQKLKLDTPVDTVDIMTTANRAGYFIHMAEYQNPEFPEGQQNHFSLLLGKMLPSNEYQEEEIFRPYVSITGCFGVDDAGNKTDFTPYHLVVLLQQKDDKGNLFFKFHSFRREDMTELSKGLLYADEAFRFFVRGWELSPALHQQRLGLSDEKIMDAIYHIGYRTHDEHGKEIKDLGNADYERLIQLRSRVDKIFFHPTPMCPV